MATLLKFPFLPELPLRAANRLIVIDAGSHSIKVLLAEKRRDRVEVLRREIINLQEEKLLSPEEIAAALKPVMATLGEYPVALVLPPQIPLSQILDLSAASEGVKQLIEAETLKNRDLRDSAIVYDCVRLQPFGRHQNSFWVTLCKEADIYQQIARVGVPLEDVYEVVPSPGVLALAYRNTGETAHQSLLVDIGATNTLVTVVLNGQAVHATTVPIAGSLLTETISTAKNSSIEAAEQVKQTKNLITGPDALPTVTAVLEGWRNEVERILGDFLRDNPEEKASAGSFRAVLSGGGVAQPGLLEYLNGRNGLKFVAWPKSTGSPDLSSRFAIAYGTALQVLGRNPQTNSLLPTASRASWNQHRIHQRFLAAICFMIVVTFVALAFGTWQKLSLIAQKTDLLDQTAIALKKAELMETVDEELQRKYERLRPVLKRQQQTLDTLNTLALLEKSRTNRNLWYVLFADQQSYFTGTTRVATNAPGEVAGSKHSFIAELCLKQEGEAMRTTLGQVVAELKQSPSFRSVDTVPVDMRKDLANPKVLIPDRHFALGLELADDSFQAPVRSSATNGPVTSTALSRVDDSPLTRSNF